MNNKITSKITEGVEMEIGDCLIVIKKDGSVGHVAMPEMNVNMQQSIAYKKLLECLDILQPGAAEEFRKYNKGKMH